MVVKKVKPDVLLGLSAFGGLFTEEHAAPCSWLNVPSWDIEPTAQCRVLEGVLVSSLVQEVANFDPCILYFHLAPFLWIKLSLHTWIKKCVLENDGNKTDLPIVPCEIICVLVDDVESLGRVLACIPPGFVSLYPILATCCMHYE
eukprot:Gb_34481 [translate_table: standard]